MQIKKTLSNSSVLFFCKTNIGRYSPASSHLLPIFLVSSKRVLQVFVYYGQIAGHHSAGAALDEAERLLLTRGIQVIKEDPSDTPSLSSMADVEVSVTPRDQNKKFDM